MNSDPAHSRATLLPVFRKTLRPLVRFALARRVPIQTVVDLLKKLYVHVSEEEFSLDNKRLTDSRISVLTGLQRKDIKAIRGSADEDENLPESAGSLARLIARWRSASGYQDEAGTPLPLQKGGTNPSFSSLVGMISHDIHPRTLLDDLLALDLGKEEDGEITLTADAFVPRADEDAFLGYLANNLGDHATAAVANVLAAPASAPHFERAVHYNRLSADSLNELEAVSCRLQQQVLEQINTQALALQNRDKGDPNAEGRFRCGTFVLCVGNKNEPTRKPAR